MNKKKYACLWTIAIPKKLLMLQWDMWQFRNQALYSSTGLTSIASHYPLNYQMSRGNVQEPMVLINQITTCFQTFIQLPNSIPCSIKDKNLWLELVCLAHREYVESTSEIIHQAISMRNQIQSFLITNYSLLPVTPRERHVATQDNQISVEEQPTASVRFF